MENHAKMIMQLARDTITIRFRFFDSALAKYKLKSVPNLNGFMADGEYIYYDPLYLLKTYVDEPGIAVRLYLHILFHSIFLHPYRYDKTNEEYWNLATDIAVEYNILQLDLSECALTRDDEQRARIAKIRKWVPDITADKLYREFMVAGISNAAKEDYIRLFTIDTHQKRSNTKEPEQILTEEDWRKISERVRAELKSFSKNKTNGESISDNLEEAVKKRYDFRDVLRRFAVSGEELIVSPDEFDLIYYTYGLNTYGNLPLIEPLEYSDTHKIKEFIIAIDTSSSCRGALVKSFLNKTFNILTSENSFFTNVNIHIIMCDSTIQQDVKITNLSELNAFMANGKLTGFGATDFRPVFEYVDELIDNNEFENLKGLIYLTDGYGIYPTKIPKYDVIFAFVGDDPNRMKVPEWALEIIFEEEI